MRTWGQPGEVMGSTARRMLAVWATRLISPTVLAVGLAAWIACAAPPTMAAAPGDPEPGSTASVKMNIPVRAFGTTVDFLIAYLVTGAPGISTGIAPCR